MRNSKVLNAVYESGYYTENYKLFQQSAESILKGSGISTDVIMDVIPEKQFYIQGRTWVADCLNDQNADNKFEDASDLIHTALNDYLNKNYIKLSEDGEKEKEEIATRIFESYQEYIRNPFVQEIANEKKAMSKWYATGLIISICCIILTIGMMLWSSRYIYRGLMQVVYICIASGAVNLIFTVFLRGKLKYDDLSPDYYVDFLRRYFDSGIDSIRFCAVILFGAAVLCWILAAQVKSIWTKSKHMRRTCDE